MYTTYDDICARRLCVKKAEWRIIWSNPKIHGNTKNKIWLSCLKHKDWLENYLKIRSFWKETIIHKRN